MSCYVIKAVDNVQCASIQFGSISYKPADVDSDLVNGQRFDSRLPCANSKPVLNLSKAVFFLIYSSLAVDGGEIKESCGCEKRFLSSLTEKKEQGTFVSQGRRNI